MNQVNVGAIVFQVVVDPPARNGRFQDDCSIRVFEQEKVKVPARAGNRLPTQEVTLMVLHAVGAGLRVGVKANTN